MTALRRLASHSLWLIPAIAACAAVLIMLHLGRRSAAPPRPAELPVLGALPAFAFTDQTGAPVTRDDLAGRVVIANFIFSRCPTVCPVTSLKMQHLGERLATSRVLLVSFSVDPEHDTPSVLAEFAARYHADPARWKFLTGPAVEMRRAVEDGLKLALDRRGTLRDGTPDIVHDLHFVLIDGRGQIRGYYDSDAAGALDQLAQDAERLAGLALEARAD